MPAVTAVEALLALGVLLALTVLLVRLVVDSEVDGLSLAVLVLALCLASGARRRR